MADQVVFEKSLQTLENKSPFVDRNIISVPDSNNNFYSNSIKFETSILSNNGRFSSLSEAYLQIPLCITLRDTDLGNSTLSDMSYAKQFLASLKSNNIHLIDSMSISYNNSV